MMNKFSLEGKTILITGASSGIGQACAIGVSEVGANLMISGRDEARLSSTLDQLKGGPHSILRADLMDKEALGTFIEKLPALDGMILAAGINKIKPAKFMKDADFDEILSINFKVPYTLVCSLLKARKIKDSASCVFIGSIASRFSAIGNSAYSGSKGALLSAVRALALETARQKIRMNVISPGQVMTPLMEKTVGTISPEVLAKNEALYPLGYGKADDVAGACVYLLSEASRWVTGHDLVMDGGFSLT